MLNLRSLHNFSKNFSNYSIRFHVSAIKYCTREYTFQSTKKRKIGAFGWFLLVIPATTFGLGTWQVQRKKWKENLIEELNKRTNINPIELPKTIEEINDLEYYTVRVRGHFIHEQEMYIGPRTFIRGGTPETASSLFSNRQSKSKGYLVVTPFKLADRPETILVNRGWISHINKDPRTRSSGQVQGDIDLIGVIRLHENRPQFMPKNDPRDNSWFYRDVKQMSKITGAEPIFIDATNDVSFEGGPIGGQTLITLRNEHLSYIITWYSLSAFTSFMWFCQFVKGIKI